MRVSEIGDWLVQSMEKRRKCSVLLNSFTTKINIFAQLLNETITSHFGVNSRENTLVKLKSFIGSLI